MAWHPSRKRHAQPTGKSSDASDEAVVDMSHQEPQLIAPSAVDGDADGLVAQSRARVRLGLGDRERVSSVVVGGAFLAAAIPLAVLPSSQRSPSLLLLAALVAAYAVTSRVLFEVGAGFAIPTQLVLVPMLFAVPTGQVPLLVLLGLVVGELPSNIRRGVPLERAIVLPASAWHAVGPAAVLLAAGEGPAEWSRWPVYAVALAAQFVFDYASASVREWLAFRISPRAHLRFAAWACSVDLALAPIGLLAATSSGMEGYAFVATLPLIGLLELFARQRRLRIDHALELGQAYRGTAFLLGDMIEADDAYTGSHSQQVVDLVLAVADELGVDADTRRDAEFAALLHDVGKINVPNEIINKRGPLNDEEWEIMRRHTIDGEAMLARVGGLLGRVGVIVRASHEHYDGSGYPDGLAGEAIPLAARIVTCCDAFNAMTTDRSYRKALSLEAATAELQRVAGTQFDPRVADAVLRVVERGDVVVEAPAAPKLVA
jgi:putative nucleotidyltransferase with HDIG domain